MKPIVTIVILFLAFLGQAQTKSTAEERIPYGNNPGVGKYVKVGDARLYYEIYGKGQPLVMLHGGVYGSIVIFLQYGIMSIFF